MKIRIITKNIIVSLAVWISYLFLLLLFFSESRDLDTSIYRSMTMVLFQAIIFYLNFYLLLPTFFEKKRFLLYFLSLIVLVIITIWTLDEIIHFFAAEESRTYIRNGKETINRHGPPRSPQGKAWFFYGRHIFNSFIILMAVFISTIVYQMKAGRKREREANLIKNQMLEAETKMLKWQINPHFLFNTLNNIYSMSQLKSDKTPDAVHRLSEMLRYVIYECNDDFVKLKQEIKYIQSYIDLLLLKDENLQNVKYDFSGINPDLKIGPMILIPFIENSFKHSKFEDADKSWINIDIKTTGNQLNFKIENSVPSTHFTKDNVGGIGITNVKKRLEMLYPGKHYLNLQEENGVYSVELIMELNDN